MNHGSRRMMTAGLTRFPVHDGNEVLHVRATGNNFLLTTRTASLVASCSAFRTAAEHARAFGAKIGAKPDDVPLLTQTLERLADEGLLVDLGAVAAAGQAAAAPPSITTIGFVTRDRPDALERAIRSYAGNAKAHHRSPRVLVCDDASAAGTRALARERLARLSKELATPLSYVGEEEKRAFAEALAGESGVGRDVIDFALFDVEGCGSTFGANRNAMLLLTAGELVLSADDDTVCRPATTPEPAPGLAFAAERDPHELWFFADIEAALASGRYVDVDFLAAHERLLGHDLASLVSAGTPDPDLSGVCSHMLHSLSTGRGRVVVTPSGIIGDSGMYSGSSFLASRGPTRERLLSSEATYASAFRSRAVLRATPRSSVAHATSLAGTVFGLDNREALVPFPPVLRHEDGGFSTLLWRCCEDAYFGYPNIAAVHSPEGARSFAPQAYLEVASNIRFADLLLLAVNTWPGAAVSHAARLRGLGNHLIDLGSCSAADFRGAMRQALAFGASGWAKVYGATLRDYHEEPAFWAKDVRDLLARRADAVTSSWLPTELSAGRSEDEVAALTQRLLRRFGELLVAWEALFAAAPAARRRAGLAER